MTNLIEAHNLVKEYQLDKKSTLKALGPVSFTIPKGSFTVIVGRSGSGKSTLLNLLTGLDKPSSGQLKVLGKDISKLNRKALAKYRSQIGIIFQQYNLIPDLTAIENVILGSWAGGSNTKLTTALELLDKFQLRHRAWANVVTLSGGEKQRVAICRALINQPQILFCDEPTGALDRKNEENVKTILQQLHQEGMTIVLVTHNLDFLGLGTQILELDDGLLVTSRQQTSSTIVPKNYQKATHEETDLWLFKEFLAKPEIRTYLTSQLPVIDTPFPQATLWSLKSIINQVSNHTVSKKILDFGFLPIANDLEDNLLACYVDDQSVYLFDKKIFAEDYIRVTNDSEHLLQRYETSLILAHAVKVFTSLNEFIKTVTYQS